VSRAAAQIEQHVDAEVFMQWVARFIEAALPSPLPSPLPAQERA
jgi:hypothetical protein